MGSRNACAWLLLAVFAGCQSGQTGSASSAACAPAGPPDCLCVQLLGQPMHVVIVRVATPTDGIAELEVVVREAYPTDFTEATPVPAGARLRVRSRLAPPCRTSMDDVLPGLAPGDELLALYVEDGGARWEAAAGEGGIGGERDASGVRGSLLWVVPWSEPFDFGQGMHIAQGNLATLRSSDACFAAFGAEPTPCRDTH